jgi:hypothetical protein
MKIDLLWFVNEEAAARMFVVDRDKNTIFFPWGKDRKGYFFTDPVIKKRFSRFFVVLSALVLFNILFLVSVLHSLIWFVGGPFMCCAFWLLIYNIYVSHITKSLPPSPKSYKDIILDKIAPDDEDEENDGNDQSILHYPTKWFTTSSEPAKIPFPRLRRFFSHLSARIYSLILFLIGSLIIEIWSIFHPGIYSGQPEEDLMMFFVFLTWGLGGYFWKRGSTPQEGFVDNRTMKEIAFGMVVMIGCWGFSLLILYRFVFGK